MTKKDLIESEKVQKWVTGKVALIQDIYGDGYAFIIIHSDMGKFTITRVFGNFQISNDYVGISAIEVFEKIFSDYSDKMK